LERYIAILDIHDAHPSSDTSPTCTRLFRKLKWAKGPGSAIIATNSPLGINSLRNVGTQIAQWLIEQGVELSHEPKAYTGHTWRRTSITWCADAGLSLPQIKAVSGHKSDTVVQGYIDKIRSSK